MMDGAQQSDAAIVAMKAANKGARAPAEPLERRAAAERNPQRTGTVRTQSRGAVSPGAERIRQFAKEKPGERLTALLHHITPEALGEAYHALKRDAAPGVDGMTWREYGDGLEERLLDLHTRVRRGAYRAAPVRRVMIPKPDGGVRPLGIASLEDKIVQRAVVEQILNPIYPESTEEEGASSCGWVLRCSWDNGFDRITSQPQGAPIRCYQRATPTG